ncbi:hypothetical protein DNTS_021758, partial [Danionella cerebrum]
MMDYYTKIRSNHRPRSAMPLSLNTQSFLRRGLSSYRPSSRLQVEDDCALTAVYVNIPRVRRSPINSTSPISSPHQDQTFLDPAGWEVHTDHQSGLQYYYHPYSGRSSWERPLSSSMDSSVATEEVRSFPHSVACSPGTLAPQRWSSDWERLLDENTGRHYFFNSVSGQSSWDPPEDVIVSPGERRSLQECTPPLPVEDYPQTPELEAAVSPASAPAEYSLIHVKKMSIPRWIKSLDDRGRTYYYLRDGCKSLWKLPEYSGNNGQYGMGNGSTGEQDTLASNWRHSTGYHDEKSSSFPSNTPDSDASSSPEMPNNVSNLEKVGILNKTKVSENGKKIRKNWGNSWTVLHGGILTFHKDPKSTPAGASSKTNQIPPEFTVHLKGATINRATRDKSSKKNVLELKSRNGAEFLIQYDTESVISDWYKVIVDTIRQLDLEQHPSENEEDISDRCPSLEREEKVFEKRTMSNASRQHSTSSTSEADQKKVKIKLKKFLLKRPTLQSVKDKGYIRENVFGCHLQNLCNQEKSRVPSFVDKCISAVDKKGLGIDGLYRVSGNLAVIQKLRFKADHEDLDLEEGNWDIHVITGALKLFFRELQEPLFPYSLFNDFIFAIKTPDYYNKIAHMRNLVRVIQHGDENRMTVQNVAIVFGPTLLKPEVETASIATYMVFQNQIVEFLLNEFESIFHNSQMHCISVTSAFFPPEKKEESLTRCSDWLHMAQRVAVSDGGTKRTSRVRVAVRLRPYMDKQDEKAEGPCVRGLGPQKLEIINWRNATETLQYQFDVFHDEQTTQKEVFLTSVKPVLPHVLNGQNASVFAYGPTGAGKTHTMLGSQEQPGIIPRAVREVFALVKAQEKEPDGWEYSVGMSYLEIYNEKVLDLLSPGSQDLPIREDKDRNILIPGLTHTPLSSFSDFDAHFIPASLNRTTASTKLNQRSSRSHAILLMKVVKSQRGPPHKQQTGKLYLVDLAGSEDNRRTGNQGIRLKESGAINLSLFTLSKVVDALNTGVGGRVPYRDSKLTRLLQDSLGGSAHSVMITNIAPEYKYYFDTFTALNFAAKSKQIVNRPFVRETVVAPTFVSAPGKRVRDEQEAGGSSERQNKRTKEGKKAERSPSPQIQPHSSPDSSVLDRLLALEKMMMGPAERERLNLLKTVAQTQKEIEMLRKKQKELEDKANMIKKQSEVTEKEPKDVLFKANLPPLHRKPSTAKPRKQQAVVTPLQVSQVQPLQQSVVRDKQSQLLEKKRRIKSEVSL